MPKPNHKASKRIPLARKYTIAKKAKEHERKQKRAAKKNPTLRKKLRKDLGIPNLNPFKQLILKKLEDQQKIVKFNDLQRQRRQQDFARKRRLGGDDDTSGLAGLAADAAARAKAYNAADAAAAESAADPSRLLDSTARAGEVTRRAFYRHVKSLLEKADILLEVLDARDPLSCRTPAVEALALSMDPPKRVVLVLNKIDLVPPAVVQQWLVRLRKEFPTVAFKASTQHQRSHLAAPGGAAVNQATEHGEVLTGAGASGADTLLQLIKNYSRSRDLKTAVTVGVVGYPNVGKSSIINSLKRGKAVSVSSTPGHTRTLQEVSLDSKVSLIDCPGVIFDDTDGGDGSAGDAGAGLLLRNCIRVEDIADPESAVDGILRRCAPEKLMALYAVPAFASTAEFLAHVATKRGKLAKGGVADKFSAARSVLQDWNSGRIPFFVLPPVAVGGGAEPVAAAAGAGAAMEEEGSGDSANEDDVDTAAIVSGWSKEFDMDEIIKAEGVMLAAGATGSLADFVSVSADAHSGKVKSTSKAAKAAAMRLLESAASDEEEESDDASDDDEEEEEESDCNGSTKPNDDTDDDEVEKDEEDGDSKGGSDNGAAAAMAIDSSKAHAGKAARMAPAAAARKVRFTGVASSAAAGGHRSKGSAAPASAVAAGRGGRASKAVSAASAAVRGADSRVANIPSAGSGPSDKDGYDFAAWFGK